MDTTESFIAIGELRFNETKKCHTGVSRECKNRATFCPVRADARLSRWDFSQLLIHSPDKIALLPADASVGRGYFGAKSLRRAHGGRDWPPMAAAPPPLTAAPYQPPPATRCLSAAVAAQIGRINRTRRVAATFNHPLARAACLPTIQPLAHSPLLRRPRRTPHPPFAHSRTWLARLRPRTTRPSEAAGRSHHTCPRYVPKTKICSVSLLAWSIIVIHLKCRTCIEIIFNKLSLGRCKKYFNVFLGIFEIKYRITFCTKLGYLN